VDQSALKERLIELLEPMVAQQGATIVDVELVGAVNNQTLRLLIHCEGGVSVTRCEEISREASDLLDLEDPIPGRYRLEVTSPGLSRPLRTDRDFQRAAGRRLKVVLTTGRNLFGRLGAWNERELELEDESGTRRIGRHEIAKATIEAEL
jgi:ribosome maturation factor RimP